MGGAEVETTALGTTLGPFPLISVPSLSRKEDDMGYASPEVDLVRAKGLKKLANGIVDPQAKKNFTDAAARLERRAGRKVRKLGIAHKVVTGPSGTGATRKVVDLAP